MKSFHIRMDDKDFTKIQDEAKGRKLSLNSFLVGKILEDLPENSTSNTQEIHDDLSEILLELTRIKYAVDDLNKDGNIEILSKEVADLKKEIIKKMTQIQTKITR